MSFSSELKLEIMEMYEDQGECDIVEIACILRNCVVFYSKNDRDFAVISTEDFFIINRIFTLLKKTFSISIEVLLKKHARQEKTVYRLVITNKQAVQALMSTYELDLGRMSDTCAKQYLTLSYLLNGTLTDPKKSYHLELIFANKETALITADLCQRFGLKANVSIRKNYYITYLKDGSNISDFLSLVNAPNAVMAFENIRILKEISGNVNRQVNLETANLNRTISARIKHEEEINYLIQKHGNHYLKPELMDVAMARIAHPELSLSELGDLLGLSKSCISHRLRRISKLAKS